MHGRALAAASVLLGCLLGFLAATPPAQAQDATWLVVSDIHLDPFDRSPFPAQAGRDGNLPLLQSAIAEMLHVAPSPSVIVLPGDFFAHHFGAVSRRHGRSAYDAGIETMELLARVFDHAFPRAQFVIALGNNDAPCGDYALGGRRFLAGVARVWEPLVNRQERAPDFVRRFSLTGSYTVTLPSGRLRLVVANTVPSSNRYGGTCAAGQPIRPGSEVAWMNVALRAAPRGTRNAVVMHIPPGYDPFTTALLQGFVAWPLLTDGDTSSMMHALTDPRNRVAYVLAGHLHRFDVRTAGGVPMVLFGSLSPNYENNPAFYRLHVETNGSLDDLQTYAYDETAKRWTGPRSFDREWGVRRIDANALAAVHARLGADAAMRQAWNAASEGGPAAAAPMWNVWADDRWRIAWCAQTFVAAGFSQCAGIEARIRVARGAATAIVALALLPAALLILRRIRQKGSIPRPP